MKKLNIPLAMFAMLPASASAELVTLNAGDAINTSSVDTAGNWSNAALPSSGNTYEVAVRYLRTPRAGASHTFPGDSLTLKTGGSILYKGTASQTLTSNLILDGGNVRSGQNDTTSFTLGGTIEVTATGGGLSPDQSPIIVNSVVSGTDGQLWLADSANAFGDPNVSGPGKLITFNAANTFTGNLRVDTNIVGATLSQTSTWAFNIGASGVNNNIFGVGRINLNGLFSFDLTGAGTALGDSWTLVDHSTLTETYGSTFAVSGFTDDGGGLWSQEIGGGLSYRFSEGSGTLTVVGPPKNLVWLGGGTVPNAWDINTTLNWQSEVPATVPFFDGDDVSFTDAGLAEPFLDITVGVAPGSLIIDSTGDYSFSGTGKITGGTGLTKSNSGQLSIGIVNDYTGPTTVNGGTLALNAGSTLNKSSELVINDGGTATLGAFNPLGTSNIPPVTISSGGTLTMSGNFSVNMGFINLDGGDLSSDGFFNDLFGSYYLRGAVNAGTGISTISAASITAPGATTFTVDDGGTLNVTGDFSNLFGSFGLTKEGTGLMSLSNTNTYGGNTTVNAGTLTLTSTGSIPNSLVIDVAAAAALIIASDDVLNDEATVSIPSGATLNLTHSGTDVVGALFIAGVEQDPGIYAFGTGSLEVRDSGFAAWITGTFSNVTVTLQGPNDDGDNDGISNLLEYAIAGMDPTVSNPAPGTLTGNSLSFEKRQPLAADITYAIEESTDLGVSDTWAEVVATQSDTGISYQLPEGPAKDFMRLKVTQP